MKIQIHIHSRLYSFSFNFPFIEIVLYFDYIVCYHTVIENEDIDTTNYRSILKQEAAIAREEGKVRFVPSKNAICKIHNAEHYTASSRCCECTKLAKVPAKQAAYWQTIKHEIKAKRKLKAVSPSQ